MSYLRYLTFKTCRVHHPDYQIILHLFDAYSSDTCGWVREKQDFQSDMGQSYLYQLNDLGVEIRVIKGDATMTPNFQSDIAKWSTLSKEGGIYLDTDQLILKPFDDLLDCDMFFCSFHIPGYPPSINTYYCTVGVLASCPGHWIPTNVSALIRQNLDRRSYQSIGPPFFRTFLTQNEERVKNDVTARNYPWVYFYPLPQPDTHCERLFAGDDTVPEASYALHWFGGYEPSHRFNASYTEEKAKTGQDGISKILRKRGLV